MLLPLQAVPEPRTKQLREGGREGETQHNRQNPASVGLPGALGAAGNAAGSQRGADVTENKTALTHGPGSSPEPQTGSNPAQDNL